LFLPHVDETSEIEVHADPYVGMEFALSRGGDGEV
jgi:hypothetical protein